MQTEGERKKMFCVCLATVVNKLAGTVAEPLEGRHMGNGYFLYIYFSVPLALDKEQCVSVLNARQTSAGQ